MRLALFSLALLSPALAAADPLPSSARAHAVRRAGSISIDGKLDEAAWQAAPKQGSFTQRFPKDGAKPTLDTQFSVLYDDEALYIAVWADDPEPHRIRRTLSRRDLDINADAVIVGIDSFHDRRTAYVFQLNAAGVQRDMLLFDDSKQDDTWDAVWTGETSVHGHGWCAEFRIPLGQLRFVGAETQEWGLQVVRMVARTNEQVAWSPWPRSAPEVVSRFGVVDGIDQLKPGRRLELLPYASGGVERMPVDDADPLNDPMNARGSIGGDVRYGLGPAFTLSATLNPDFGQVEADPSQINLSGNELFFAEKRPFFLEGVDLFKLPIGQSDNSVENVFYSRRIGAAPPSPEMDYDYISAPQSTTIYGAAKLTGKTRSGWSIGVFDAVTGEESATVVDASGAKLSPVVAPLTNYALARVKRDLNEGRTSLGASLSAVNRKLDGTGLEGVLHDQAYTAGLQALHRFKGSPYQFDIHGVASYVHGSEEAIARTQRSVRHLYQRPDIESGDRFDPTRTSLSGFDISWKAGKLGETKHWRWGSGGDLRTRGLELNDLGFQNASDHTIPYVFLNYTDQDPGDEVLNYQLGGDVYMVSTLEPRVADVGLEWNANVQLANYWQLAHGGNASQGLWDTRALRGGPALRGERRLQGWVNIVSDTRKRVWVSFNAWGGRTPAAHATDGGFEAGVTIQARSNIDVFLGPSYSDRKDAMQYVDQLEDAQGNPHYIFAKIRQTVAGLTVRLNWTFSPRLSLQAYAQPFIANGSYSEYKDVTNPGADKFEDRFVPITMTAFPIGRPDFDFMQLRSTLVLRWEYRPGSSLYAIWSHGRTGGGDNGHFDVTRDLGNLGDAAGENIVMVKANYWIGL